MRCEYALVPCVPAPTPDNYSSSASRDGLDSGHGSMNHTHDHQLVQGGHARRFVGPGIRVALAGVALAVLGVVWVGDLGAQAASAKITICHRAHSTTNPYRRITISQSAVQNGRHGGHRLPSGSTNPAVFDSTFSYAPNNKYWGDIIPGATNGGSAYNGTNTVALNWTAAGQAIFFSAQCGGLSAREFYDVEIAAGIPPQAIIDDLNDMQANEDAALLAALGGPFTVGSVDSWEATISVTTNSPTALTTTSGVISGTLVLGSAAAVSGFEWGTDPGLVGAANVGATPSSVTATTNVTAPLSGLSPGTTYYYRVTATTSAGTASEGVLYGAIVAFTTPSIGTTSTTSVPDTTAPPTSGSTTVPDTTVPPSTSTTTVPDTTAPPSTSTTAVPDTTIPPSNSTTVPTSTVPIVPTTTVPGGPQGEVRGVAWFDTDRDSVLDSGEALLSNALVELRPASSAAPTERFGAGVASFGPIVPLTTRTGADGRYAFTGLELGSYTVVATVPSDGIERTFDTDGRDTDGRFDWTVSVTVVEGVPGIADFAGRGGGTMTGHLVQANGVPAATTTRLGCTWAGSDGMFATADDSTFTTVTNADGSFTLDGVPYGQFECAAAASSGQVPTSIRLAVSTTQPTTLELPLTGAVAGNRLPTTGVDSSQLITPAFALLTVGAGLLTVGRRNRRRTVH